MTEEEKLNERLEWLEGNYDMSEDERRSVLRAMVEFANFHVGEALQEASEKATMKLEYPDEAYQESNETGLKFACADDISRGGEYGSVEIEEDSILNAYPLSKIK